MASLVPGARGLGRGLVPRLSLRRLSLSCSLPARGEQPLHIRRRTEAARAGPSAANILEDEQKGVFRVKNIQPPKREEWKQFKRGPGGPVPPPRAAEMVPGQAWGDVWPAARTFHPATVPLPVRQGVIQTKQQVVPSKWANAELLKVVNFLHLTPPVVAKHCAALTKFCTAWPRGLETEEDTEHHFPLTVVTSDHLNSGSSVRDRRARIVTLQFKVDSLSLDGRARDKFIRLVGERYNEETGLVTLTADRCPYRGQNRDYAGYLLTALFHESLREEDWEEKGTEDLEHFPAGERGEGRQALEAILNSGEDEAAVARYTEEVRRLLGLPEATIGAEVVGGQ